MESIDLYPGMGCVYFLAESGRYDPRIKIGKTKNPNVRMLQITPKLPTESVLLHVIHTCSYESMNVFEKWLHEEYDDKRCNGEWFDLDADDVVFWKMVDSVFELRDEPNFTMILHRSSVNNDGEIEREMLTPTLLVNQHPLWLIDL